jgi:hypothetical protein
MITGGECQHLNWEIFNMEHSTPKERGNCRRDAGNGDRDGRAPGDVDGRELLMPEFIKTTVRVDGTRLNRGIELAMEFTTRAPADTVNFAAKEVAFGAYARTPVTGASRVDAELGVIGRPVIGVSGKTLKGKFNYKGTAKKRVVRNGRVVEVPFAVLIVQARTRPGSNYNVLTGGRYQLPPGIYKGLTAKQGQMLMAMYVDLMIKARHRSANGFIRAGFIPAMTLFKALSPVKYGGGGGNIPPGQNTLLGRAVPALAGQTDVFAIIENDAGVDNRNASHNAAMLRVGAPALQAAMDEEGRKQMEYALRKAGEEDLRRPVQAAWGG